MRLAWRASSHTSLKSPPTIHADHFAIGVLIQCPHIIKVDFLPLFRAVRLQFSIKIGVEYDLPPSSPPSDSSINGSDRLPMDSDDIPVIHRRRLAQRKRSLSPPSGHKMPNEATLSTKRDHTRSSSVPATPRRVWQEQSKTVEWDKLSSDIVDLTPNTRKKSQLCHRPGKKESYPGTK
jgi:hypothetical protein